MVTIDQKPLTLNDIEHRILRPIWRDPLIHYGVNCASLGCPNLVVEPYSADNVDELLASNARDFIGSERGVKVTSRGLNLSKIYQWFAEDFGQNEPALLAHLQRYADTKLAAELAQRPAIRKYQYDWDLNDAP